MGKRGGVAGVEYDEGRKRGIGGYRGDGGFGQGAVKGSRDRE